MFAAVLHRANGGCDIRHQVNLVRPTGKVLVNRVADAVSVTHQNINGSVDPIDACLSRDVSFLLARLLRFERVLHFDFGIGTDSNLLWGIHLFFLTGLAVAKYTQFAPEEGGRDAH